ncbi:hypothetical protein [Butyrivibrio sp. AE3004]|uniref:hypothetical protein n=1 Tax=Butyrivibrio sp. AE3004 TaxID=1506994 RepID=UPI000A853985|nr:hypothetical protein [Butyrivibrio sp. AE3004]
MNKKNFFHKKNTTIIDAIEYNGKYTDVSTLRNRFITIGIVVFTVALFLCVPIFFL